MKNLQRSITGHTCASMLLVATLISLLGLQPMPVLAQQVQVLSGTYINNLGALAVTNNSKLVNGGTFNNGAAGSVNLSGNWQNDGTYNGATGSLVNMNGSAVQDIGGANPTTFSNLTLNNSSGFTLSNNATINGTLNFQGGIITPGANLFTIGASGTITNPGASKYVNGQLLMTFNATGSKLFPIGKGGNYRPLTFQYTGLTGTSVVSSEQFETPVTGTVPVGYTLLSTNRHWTVSQTGGTNTQYFVTLDPTGYTPTHPVFMLKQDLGVITTDATTTPNYTNTTAYTSFSDFGLAEFTGFQISGVFTYNNAANTPLDAIWVMLKQGGTTIDMTQTNQYGQYSFSGKSNGLYKLAVTTTKPWGGVNGTDALLVKRKFLGYITFPTQIRDTAADVTNDKSINGTDALHIERRFDSLQISFVRGDWVFKKVEGGDSLVVSNNNLLQNFYGLCVGDVNGSYTPPAGAKSTGIGLVLDQRAMIGALPGDIVEIPVWVNTDLNIGAVSMVVGYPGNLLKIREIRISHGNPVYNIGHDGLRMVWAEMQPLDLHRGETMMTLVVQVSDQFTVHDRITLALNQESELADAVGTVLENIVLNAPTIIHKNSVGVNNLGSAGLVFEVYPVPSNGLFNTSIVTPCSNNFDIRVYNCLGQVVAEMKDIRVDGKSGQQFDLRSAPNGFYTVVLQYNGGSVARKIVINH